jgi:hypothetical protein
MKKSQCQLVLDHLIDHGYITEVIARNYGVKRLASRVHDLKAIASVPVQKEMRTDDLGAQYAYYYIADSAREEERQIRDVEKLGWNMQAAA